MQPKTYICKFYVDHAHLTQDHVAGTSTGFLSPRFAYIEAGECLCVSEEGELPLKAGDVWILPAKKPYRSIWTAKPTVDFFYCEYEAELFSLSVKHFSKIEDYPEKHLFEKMYRAENDLQRLACFYSVLEKILSYVSETDEIDPSPIFPALEYLKDHYEEPVKVSELARACALSESKFYKEFKRITDSSPIEYKNAIRIKMAAEMIGQGITLEKVCEKLHYSSPAFLRRQVIKYFGITPRELKRKDKPL